MTWKKNIPFKFFKLFMPWHRQSYSKTLFSDLAVDGIIYKKFDQVSSFKYKTSFIAIKFRLLYCIIACLGTSNEVYSIKEYTNPFSDTMFTCICSLCTLNEVQRNSLYVVSKCSLLILGFYTTQSFKDKALWEFSTIHFIMHTSTVLPCWDSMGTFSLFVSLSLKLRLYVHDIYFYHTRDLFYQQQFPKAREWISNYVFVVCIYSSRWLP